MQAKSPHSAPYANPYAPPTVKETPPVWPFVKQIIRFVVASAVFFGLPVLAGAFAACPFLPDWWALGLLVGVAVGFLGSIAYAAVARTWSALWIASGLLGAAVLNRIALGMLLLCLPIGLPVVLISRLAKRVRHQRKIIFSLTAIALGFGCGVSLYGQLRHYGLWRSTKHAEHVISAIERYRADTGDAPKSLEDLVPKYLEDIPSTGMAGFRRFEYTGPGVERDDGWDRIFPTYELRVKCYRFLQFDQLVYWPEGNYPDFMYSGIVEKIGHWAYVHE